MFRILGSFLFKLVLTVAISIFIGFQLAKIEFKESSHTFKRILGVEKEVKADTVLQSEIEKFLADQDGDYAIYVKDLKPGGTRNVFINSQEQYQAASLYKLYLMAAVYMSIKEGELTMETEISAKLSHLEEILGSVDYGYQHLSSEEIATYTVRECLDRIARISDNYAAIMLAEKIGWTKVQDAAQAMGATSTVIRTPISTTAEDAGMFLEKLYKGEMVSFDESEDMINFLASAQVNDRIPAKLPETDPSTGSALRIAHKTGELSGVRNDAGIVFLQGNPYVIVMMSKNLKGEDQGVETLAQVSKIVYDYYSSVNTE